MDYLLTFFEGIITFISPCLLPLLPVYISFFAGQDNESKRKTTILNAFGFVLGFTLVFVTLGAFAGTVGMFLKSHRMAVNIATGIIMVIFGLSFLEVIKIPFLNPGSKIALKPKQGKLLSCFLFGVIFSLSWTPCTGAFLGSALMLAASSGGSMKGVLMLLCYSLGLGLPFMASALLIDQLKSAFDFIKKNYKVIRIISGCLLIIIGILTALGLMVKLVSLLSF